MYRDYIDENESVVIQYVVSKHLRNILIEKAHDSVFSAHQGKDKMKHRLRSRCYWPKMNIDIEQHIKECHTCQETKPPSRYNQAELKPITSKKPLELVTTDIMGKLNTTKKGNNYIMVIIDHFTRWMELFALNTMEAIEVAEKLLEFTCRHGSPLKILSDQGTNYQSELLNELYEILDIEKLKTTPYHPECDGLSERSNRTNKMALTTLVNGRMDNWDELLPQIQLAYNSSVNKTTNCSPFELMYGRQPRLPLDLFIPEMKVDFQLAPGQYAECVKSSLETGFRLVKKNIDTKVIKNKIIYDRRARAAKYKIGDNVMLLDEAIKKGTLNKLRKKWKGPYKVLEIDNSGRTIEVKPILKNGRSLRVNICKLKTYFKTIEYLNTPPQNIIKIEPDSTLDESNQLESNSPETLKKSIHKFKNSKKIQLAEKINKKSRTFYKKKNKSASVVPKSIKQSKDPSTKISNSNINEENLSDIQRVSQDNDYRRKLRPKSSNILKK